MRRPLAILPLLLLAACSPAERNGGGSGAGSGRAPETFVIGVSAQPDYLNPLVANSAFATRLAEILFLRLVEFGPPPDYAFTPQLAESWELSDGDRVLTYHLRRDITWHDGVPTTAHDVVYTFDMAADPDVPFPERSKIRHLQSWEALDDWTVRFTFHERSWEPLYDTQVFIVPKHVLEGTPGADMMTHPFARNPVGSGPFRFVDWVPEVRVTLAANDAWPEGRPGFERLVFRVISEETTLHTEFLTGGVDMYQRFPNKYYRQDAGNPDLEFPRFTDRGYVYLGWNHRNPLFQDVRVRRALTMATDRQTIISAFRDGFGEVASAPLFLEHPDRRTDLTPLPFDPARAAALLDEAGWTDVNPDGLRVKDGVPFAFTFMLISNNEISEEIATLVNAEYGKLGIGVSTEFYEWTVYLERLRAKSFDATVLARVGDWIFDPEEEFHSRSIPSKYNDISFGNPVTDSLIDLAKSTPDRTERRKVWWAFQEEFQKLQPITVLYVSETPHGLRRGRVENPLMDARGPFYQIAKWRPAGGRR